jgi:hypothetical protein
MLIGMLELDIRVPLCLQVAHQPIRLAPQIDEGRYENWNGVNETINPQDTRLPSTAVEESCVTAR